MLAGVWDGDVAVAQSQLSWHNAATGSGVLELQEQQIFPSGVWDVVCSAEKL